MAEFHNYFGYGAKPVFAVRKAEEGEESDFTQRVGAGDDATIEEYVIEQKAGKYLLYNSMKLFFSNGGGPCYIVAVDTYGKEDQTIDAAKLSGGIEPLVKEQEPTMVVIPDVCGLNERADAIAVQQATLMHCGDKMKNRVAVLDVYDGYKDRRDPDGDPVTFSWVTGRRDGILLPEHLIGLSEEELAHYHDKQDQLHNGSSIRDWSTRDHLVTVILSLMISIMVLNCISLQMILSLQVMGLSILCS